EPILCHSTGPPSPVSVCRDPRRRKTSSSPTFHLALLTNWKTPIEKPWFHPRSAIPNAAVDFPFPVPVCTAVMGRLRRCRVVRPSSGTESGSSFPCAMTRSVGVARRCPATASSGRAEDPGHGVVGQFVEGDDTGPEFPCQRGRRPQADPSALTVHHHRRGQFSSA